MKYLLVATLSLALAACGGTTVAGPATASSKAADRPSTGAPMPTIAGRRGLEAVLGKDAASLTRLFGEPRLNVVEAYGRKLQFAGKACILDAYLYPDGKNNSEVVTHVDARRSDGAEVDRAACVNALLN